MKDWKILHSYDVISIEGSAITLKELGRGKVKIATSVVSPPAVKIGDRILELESGILLRDVGLV